MTVISKLAETGNKFPPNRPLQVICFASSSISVILLLKLYRKTQSNQITLTSKVESVSSKNKPNPKKRVNQRFLADLTKILRILIPGWKSSEVGYMSLISSMLIVRSLCDLWTIYLGTLMESSIISGNKSRFTHHLTQFAMTMPLMSLTNVLLKYSTRQLELGFRTRLTHFLMKKYLYKLTFYKLNQSMRNVDQVLTTDVEKFASTVANLYSQISKPILDILIYVYGISRSLGGSVPGTMLGYLGIALVLIARLRKPMAKFTSEEQAFEGEYRFGNSRIITNCEEISFYKGGSRELEWISECFLNLYNHLDSFIAFKFISEYFENFVAKYFATVVGYYAVGRPFFNVGTSDDTFASKMKTIEPTEGREMSQEMLQKRQESYYKSGRMLVNMSQAIGKFVLNAKDLSRLAGYTGRISDLIRTLNNLNTEEDERLEETPSSQKIGKFGNSIIGRYVIQDHIIKFQDVPIITPTGDVLLKALNMEVKSGMNVLVSGPNGSGKSSLFRILGELWPLFGGVLTKPSIDKLFYVPQKPYMPYGTFRDQVIYPDSKEEMEKKHISDKDLVEIMKIVDLDWMVLENIQTESLGMNEEKNENFEECFEQVWHQEESKEFMEAGKELKEEEAGRTLGQRRSWDSVENWMDVLSGGQKQRLAMARLFYHKPQFAILDECTSAVSVDIEGIIYQRCRKEGITLFTVTHRKSLWPYHEYVLHMDGRGGYSFNEIDTQSQQQSFGGS